MNNDLIGNIGYILVAISFMVRDIVWLRILSIFAASFGIVFNYYASTSPLWIPILWNAFFMLINVSHIALTWRERHNVHLSEEEEELRATSFGGFLPIEFAKLMRLAEWQNVPANEKLTLQGDELDSIMLLQHGTATTVKNGEKISILKDGSFIGAMSLALNKPAAATIMTSAPSRIVKWKKSDLNAFIARNPSIGIKFKAAMDSDMASRLQIGCHEKIEQNLCPKSSPQTVVFMNS